MTDPDPSAPDPSTPSNDTLRQLILAEAPELASLLETDRLAAARLIVDWTASAANWSFSTSIMRASTNRACTETPAETYFNQFLPRVGGGYCGLQGIFTSGVLKLFGFDSFIYDFGDLRYLSHVTAVVPIWDVDHWRYYIIDPTFNMIFMDSQSGEQLDAFQMLDMVAAGEGSRLVSSGLPMDERVYLAETPIDVSGFSQTGTAGNLLLYNGIGWGFDTWLVSTAPYFQQLGYSPSVAAFAELMAHRTFSVGSSSNDAARADFIAGLDARGVPYGIA